MLGEMLKNIENLAENKVNNQSEWLINGVKSRIYQPLLKRPASGKKKNINNKVMLIICLKVVYNELIKRLLYYK